VVAQLAYVHTVAVEIHCVQLPVGGHDGENVHFNRSRFWLVVSSGIGVAVVVSSILISRELQPELQVYLDALQNTGRNIQPCVNLAAHKKPT
jgi:hypothetical protein